MKCPYCDTEFDMETLSSYDDGLQNEQDNMEWETSAGGQWQDGEADGLRPYVCKSCGGEIGQFSGALKPDLVIPFKLDKKAAKAGLMQHLAGKRLLPKVFKDQNHIDEIKGVYVPFWLFDADADAQVRYKATKVREWSDNDYDYKDIEYYLVRRAGSHGFEHDAVEFQTAYLAGYLADKYDVDAEQSVERANERVKKSTEAAFASTVQGYDTVTAESSSIQLRGGKAKYALYPVWLLNTTWNGGKYTFAMNGQTGKFIGDLPVDKSAATKLTIGLAAALSAASYAVVWLLHIIGLL